MKKVSWLGIILTGTVSILVGCGLTPNTSDRQDASGNPDVKPGTVNNQSGQNNNSNQENSITELAPFFQTTEVDYYAPKKLETDEVLAPYKQDMLMISEKVAKQHNPAGKASTWGEIAQRYSFYEVGKINKAPYAGWKLLVLRIDCDGPCFSLNVIRLAWDENNKKLVQLEKLSTSEYNPDESAAYLQNADKTFVIKGLTPPSSIVLPDGINSIELKNRDAEFTYNQEDSEYNLLLTNKIAFTDANLGNLYFSEGVVGCLILQLPDGTTSTYTYDPKLLGDKSEQTIKPNNQGEAIDIWNKYSLLQHGCGIGSSCYFVEDVKKEDLVSVGKTNKGVELFVSKDKTRIVANKDGVYDHSNKALNTLNSSYDNYLDMRKHNDVADQKPLLSFEQFVATYPILYWQDPLGRFSAIISNDITEGAECGKPVVYLYPEKTMDVSVKVHIDELTKTIPEYGNGWKVKATPSSEIYNYADGQTYPYLFWEGKKNGGIEANAGSVVAKADLEKFLQTSLAELGLNEKESSEFREFWLPKMMAINQPYLLISFAGTEEFNKVAPLEITPKPETLIRVFMYYMPISEKLNVPAQKLTSKARKGFTVVEWGGTSSDGWQTK